MRGFLYIGLVFALVALACQHPPPTELDPIDQYVLRNLFVGSLDSFSPIGARGNPIRTKEDLWLVIPVTSPPHPANTDEVNAYFERALCFYRALEEMLDPESPSYDFQLEQRYREANAEATASVRPTATMGELRDRVYEIFLRHGLLRRLVEKADAMCDRVTTIPDSVRAVNEYLELTQGITGRRSFSGPNEPCAIFRYCASPDGPALVYDVGTLDKQACFTLHEQLLEEENYRSLYAAGMGPYLEQVTGIPPENAAAFLSKMYADIPHAKFYIQLLAAYEQASEQLD